MSKAKNAHKMQDNLQEHEDLQEQDDLQDFNKAVKEYVAKFKEPILVTAYLGVTYKESAQILRDRIASGKPFSYGIPKDANI